MGKTTISKLTINEKWIERKPLVRGSLPIRLQRTMETQSYKSLHFALTKISFSTMLFTYPYFSIVSSQSKLFVNNNQIICSCAGSWTRTVILLLASLIIAYDPFSGLRYSDIIPRNYGLGGASTNCQDVLTTAADSAATGCVKQLPSISELWWTLIAGSD